MPRNTAVFAPTFRGEGVVRSDDITKDPRYGRNAPYRGMPEGHLPVRSYLAVPVVGRSGEVAGGLFFGHPEPAVFGELAEQLLVGIAAQAAVALENAELYRAARHEIEERRRAEKTQALLLAELNHRVKNTLAVVGSVAWASFADTRTLAEGREALTARLVALARAHDLLTASG
jgi:GAF domain-containing protein